MNADQHEVENFDITLFDEQGDVLAEIESFAMRRIASPSEAFKQNVQHRATLPAHSGIDAGNEIDPAAGARALMRLLSVETPNVVVAVARPIEELRHPAAQPVVGVAKAEALESPLPGDSVEHTIAAWWREMLGVETVAKEDNFFDLGGHSLIGVRLLARIKRTYLVDLDLSHLFEADTIGKLAALIESLRPAGDAGRNEN
jgi:acyl carrier protein